MWIIARKEWLHFFNSLTGYIALVLFLLLNGLFLFVFPETNLLDFGYASLQGFFSLEPWILLFLIPTITMRSLADEYRSGTFEILKTSPLTPSRLVWGKFLGCLLVVSVSLAPTLIYAITMEQLSAVGGVDMGAMAGSYLGLIFLAGVFTSIGICTSSFTSNTVIAFIAGAFICFFFYNGFDALSKFPVFRSGTGYYIEMLGINFHYNSISRGVIELRDILYFAGVIVLFLLIAQRNIIRR